MPCFVSVKKYPGIVVIGSIRMVTPTYMIYRYWIKFRGQELIIHDHKFGHVKTHATVQNWLFGICWYVRCISYEIACIQSNTNFFLKDAGTGSWNTMRMMKSSTAEAVLYATSDKSQLVMTWLMSSHYLTWCGLFKTVFIDRVAKNFKPAN